MLRSELSSVLSTKNLLDNIIPMISFLADSLDVNGSAFKGTVSAFGFDKMISQLIHFSAESSPLVFRISYHVFLLGLRWTRSIARASMLC